MTEKQRPFAFGCCPPSGAVQTVHTFTVQVSNHISRMLAQALQGCLPTNTYEKNHVLRPNSLPSKYRENRPHCVLTERSMLQRVGPVPRQNSIRVQNGLGFEVRKSLEGTSRLRTSEFGNDGELKMQRRRGLGGPADTPLPAVIFKPDGSCSQLQRRRRGRSDDADRQALASLQP